MNLKVLRFDSPLIGGDFEEGYRLILGEVPFQSPNNGNHGLDLTDVMNWICDEFGSDGYTNHLSPSVYSIQNPGVWKCLHRSGNKSIKSSRPSLSIIARDLDLIEKLCEKFSFTFSVDENSTLESQIRKVIEPFIFKLATQKIQRRIAAGISEVLRKNSFNVPWYRVHFNLDEQVIAVKLNELKTIQISMRAGKS